MHCIQGEIRTFGLGPKCLLRSNILKYVISYITYLVKQDDSKRHTAINTERCSVAALTWRWLCWGSLRACGGWRPGRWQRPAWPWTRSTTLAGSGWRCIPVSPWQNAASRVCIAAADETALSDLLLSAALRETKAGTRHNRRLKITRCWLQTLKSEDLLLFCIMSQNLHQLLKLTLGRSARWETAQADFASLYPSYIWWYGWSFHPSNILILGYFPYRTSI